MKKLIAMLLAAVMMVSLAACGSNPAQEDDGEVDMSKFPADLAEWLDEDINDYFAEKGVYENTEWISVQAKDVWEGTPVAGASVYQSTDGTLTACITVLRVTDEGAEDMLREITESAPHSWSGLQGLTFDAVVGPFAFCYSLSESEDVRTAMKDAIAELAAEMNVTPAFCEE